MWNEIDRIQEFKNFVDQGGYVRRDYWREPFIEIRVGRRSSRSGDRVIDSPCGIELVHSRRGDMTGHVDHDRPGRGRRGRLQLFGQ